MASLPTRSALLLVCLTMTRVAVAQSLRLGPESMRDTTLANGLQVIAIRNPTIPEATAVVVIRAGGFLQTSEAFEGIPHLIEHMMYKSFDRANGRPWQQAVSELGAGFNGETTEESVMYFLRLPAANVTRGIRVLSDLVRSPTFVAEDIKPETQVVRNELERNVANPNYLLYFMVNQSLWGPDWSKKDVGGNVFALGRATPVMLDTLYRRYYTPNNSAVVVSGDIVISDVFAAAKQNFGGWKKGPVLQGGAATVPMSPLAKSLIVPVQATAPDVTLQIEWHGPSASEDPTGAMAAQLFAALVNNRSSLIQQRLVDAGLFQSVDVEYQMLNHVGPITLTARTTPDKAVAATAALQTELSKLSDPASFTDEDLRLAKKYWRVGSALEWERATSLAMVVAQHWAVAGLASYTGYGDGIAARTVPDVRQFIERYIAGKPHIIGIMASVQTQGSMGASYNTLLNSWVAK